MPINNQPDLKGALSPLLESIQHEIQSYLNTLDTEYISDISAHLQEYKNNMSAYGYEMISDFTENIISLLAELNNNQLSLNDTLKEILQDLPTHLRTLTQNPELSNETVLKQHNAYAGKINKMLTNKHQHAAKNTSSNHGKFQEVFKEEADDLINQLEEYLLQLEGNYNDADAINQIFRIIHTLKGNSNMFGYCELASITHYLENIYDNVRGNQTSLSREIFDLTLNCLDHFRNLLEDPDLSHEENKTIHQQYLAQIKALSGINEEKTEKVEKAPETIENLKSFYIFFSPHPQIMDDGTNPLFLLSDLHALGECLVFALSKDIPANTDFNPAQSYLKWHIILATEKPQDEIDEVFMFLDDKSQPYIEKIADYSLLASDSFKVDFLKLAENNNKPLESDEMQTIISSQKAQKTASGKSNQHISVIRVASQKVDIMMNLISELITKQAELSMLAKNSQNTQLKEVSENIEAISRNLRDNAFSISLIPLEKSVLRFQRLVRDVANKFNKKVNFKVEGKETELDKTIIEKMTDPVMHILRNGIDHGIEMPDERKKSGKPEEGTILLRAYPAGTNVVIEITDDGRGIDLEKVKQTAIKKGYLLHDHEPGRQELLDLIITPGFTTANQVSEVSGRGVGMDVVNQRIKEIRGELEIQTEKGVGTTIIVKLPLTISIIDSLLTRIGSRNFIMPLAAIYQCEEIKSAELINRENNYLVLNNEYVPFIDLRKEFDVKDDLPEYTKLVILNESGKYIALTVDDIIGQYQAVLKPIGDVYRRQDIISGASILGDGEIALVIDTARLVNSVIQKNDDEKSNNKKIAI
ncbi:MAG: chemotaxis protein CheA [Bacteroidetes bacterium]|jgi:two-component system chemotaxis sensor kinase CheA|nr:chemotaxis protein CheA [Bacteroidota bacterium]